MNEEMEMTAIEETENEETCAENVDTPVTTISGLGLAAGAVGLGMLIGLGVEAGKAIPGKTKLLAEKIKNKKEEVKERRLEKKEARKALKASKQDSKVN